MALLDLLLMGGVGISVTYPATVTNGYPFTWSVVNGKPNDGWWITVTGAFSVTYGSSGSPYAYLNSSGNATYTDNDFSPNFGTVTVTINFQSGTVITKTVTVSKGVTPTVTMPTEQEVGTPFVWTITGGVPGKSYIVRSTNTYAGTEGNWGTLLFPDPTGSISNTQILDDNGTATNTIYRSATSVINFGVGWDYGAANLNRTITLTFTFSNGAVVTKTINVVEPKVAFTSTLNAIACAGYLKDFYWIIAGGVNGKLLVSTDKGTKWYQKIFAYKVNNVLTQRTDVTIKKIKYFPNWDSNSDGLWIAVTSIGCFYGNVSLWRNTDGTGFNSETFSSMEWIPLTDLNTALGNNCTDATYWNYTGAIYAINNKICVRYGFSKADIGVSRVAVYSKSVTTYINSTTSSETVTNNYTPLYNFTAIHAPAGSDYKSSLLIGDSNGGVYHLAVDPYAGSIYPVASSKPTYGDFEFRLYGQVSAYNVISQTTINASVRAIRSSAPYPNSNYLILTDYNVAIPQMVNDTGSPISAGKFPSSWSDSYNVTNYRNYFENALTNVPTVGLTGTGVYSVGIFSENVSAETGSGTIRYTPIVGGSSIGQTYFINQDIPRYVNTTVSSNGLLPQYPSVGRRAALLNYSIYAAGVIPITVSGYSNTYANFYVGASGIIQKEIVYSNVNQLSNSIINNGGTIKCVYLQVV